MLKNRKPVYARLIKKNTKIKKSVIGKKKNVSNKKVIKKSNSKNIAKYLPKKGCNCGKK